jgi:hypothetical protein
MVRAVRVELTLATLSTLFLCLLGYARIVVAHGGIEPAVPDVRGRFPDH